MSYWNPAACKECGGRLVRKSNTDPNLVCIECKREFEMLEVKT